MPALLETPAYILHVQAHHGAQLLCRSCYQGGNSLN
jgi:hypothetical protein